MNIELQSAQRKLSLQKITIFNIVKSVRYFRDLMVSFLSSLNDIITFQSKYASALEELGNAMLLLNRQIHDLRIRVNKLDGGGNE